MEYLAAQMIGTATCRRMLSFFGRSRWFEEEGTVENALGGLTGPLPRVIALEEVLRTGRAVRSILALIC